MRKASWDNARRACFKGVSSAPALREPRTVCGARKVHCYLLFRQNAKNGEGCLSIGSVAEEAWGSARGQAPVDHHLWR